MAPQKILEKRTFRVLPDADIGFSKPALEYETVEGDVKVKLAHESKAPAPELARKAGDPGYWTVTVWLPPDALPLRLIPDPTGPQL